MVWRHISSICICWYQGQGHLQRSRSNIKVTFLKKWPFWGHLCFTNTSCSTMFSKGFLLRSGLCDKEFNTKKIIYWFSYRSVSLYYKSWLFITLRMKLFENIVIKKKHFLLFPQFFYPLSDKYHVKSAFLAPLAVGQRAYVMVCCLSCVRPSVRALTFSLNIFFSETTYQILMKFYRNVPAMVLFRIFWKNLILSKTLIAMATKLKKFWKLWKSSCQKP